MTEERRPDDVVDAMSMPAPIKSGIPIGAFTGPEEQQEVTPVTIGVCGCSRSGKTVFAQRLADTLQWALVPEMLGDELRARGYENIKDVPDSVLVQLQHWMLERQVDAVNIQNAGRNCVTDTTPIDRLAFALRNYARMDNAHRDLGKLWEYAKRCVQLYDMIVVLPWPGWDKSRTLPFIGTSPWYQLSLQEMIQGLIWEFTAGPNRFCNLDGAYPVRVLHMTTPDMNEWLSLAATHAQAVLQTRYELQMQGRVPKDQPVGPSRTDEPDKSTLEREF